MTLIHDCFFSPLCSSESLYRKENKVLIRAIQSCVIYILEVTIVKKTSYLPYYYFNGDASDPNVVAVIRTNFISLLKRNYRFLVPYFAVMIRGNANRTV